MFSGVSNRIQNDLIEAVGEVMRDAVNYAASFVAVEKPVHCHSSAMLYIGLIRMFVNKGCQGTSG